MVTRTEINVLEAAVGGSKTGPSIATFHVTCASGILLRLASIASQHGGVITFGQLDFEESKQAVYPLFYPSNAKDHPPIYAMELTSDSKMRSLCDEAIRVWDAACTDMQKRFSWFHTLGAHPCVSNRLLEPFEMLEATIVVPNEPEDFVSGLINDLEHPDVRILGYRAAVQMLVVKRPLQKEFHGFAVGNGRWHKNTNPYVEKTLDQLLLDRPSWAM